MNIQRKHRKQFEGNNAFVVLRRQACRLYIEIIGVLENVETACLPSLTEPDDILKIRRKASVTVVRSTRTRC